MNDISRTLIACLLAVPLRLHIAAAQTLELPHPAISLAGWEKTTIFRWRLDKCETSDTPDEPPRAFRDYRGVVHFFATHEDNRASLGPDFDHLRHDCRIVFIGHHSSNPGDFSDRVWLTAFSTEDGKHITALAHDEFQGNLRKNLCPSEDYMSCWENALTLVTSSDGGTTFAESSPRKLVASLPYQYQGQLGRPIGYFQPSNIVSDGSAYYVMFHTERFREQDVGDCVARAESVADPSSWRAWDGQRYAVSFVNPYADRVLDPSAHVCSVVGKGSIFDFGSLAFDPQARLFIATTAIMHGSGNSYTPPGVYFATSADLIHWSQPTQILSEADLLSHDEEKHNYYGFFSIIDEASNSVDYSTFSAHPKLFLYYVEMNQLDAPYDRNLVKLPLRFELIGPGRDRRSP